MEPTLPSFAITKRTPEEMQQFRAEVTVGWDRHASRMQMCNDPASLRARLNGWGSLIDETPQEAARLMGVSEAQAQRELRKAKNRDAERNSVENLYSAEKASNYPLPSLLMNGLKGVPWPEIYNKDN